MPITRSLINRNIDIAKEVFAHFGIALPAWAYWTSEQWRNAGAEYDEVRDCMLGWDVTDFGSNDFENIGRVLFTVRNGRHNDPSYPKTYAEKLILDPENQRAPAHFHKFKREDIICRFGGNMLVQLTNAGENNQPSDEPVICSVDSVRTKLPAGGVVRLEPGQSVTIPPRTIHQFWGEEGTGLPLNGKRYTVSSEISSVCDDHTDNFFFDDSLLRFPEIIEDETPRVMLCQEYPKAFLVGHTEENEP